MKGERISSLFLMLLALYILKESFSFGVGGLHQPGSGFFSMVGGIFLFIFSTLIFLKSLVAKSAAKGGKSHDEKESPLPVVYTVAGIIIYTFLLEHVGFILTTFVLVVLLLKLFENKKWWADLLTAGLVSSAFYVLFAFFLKSELPKGILEPFF